MAVAQKHLPPMQFTGEVGSHITQAIQQAIEASKKNNRDVVLKFNETKIDVTRDSDIEERYKYYEQQCAISAETWRNSPEGRKAAAEQKERLAFCQANHDRLMQEIAQDAKNIDWDYKRAVHWLLDYAVAADRIGVVNIDYPAVIAHFEELGFKKNDATGLDKEAYDDPSCLASYIVGQALDMMHTGMPPHPNYMDIFVERFDKLST